MNRMPRTALILVALMISVPPASALRTWFDPQTGFIGRSEGNGTLKLLFGKPREFHVESEGHILPDGRFRLDQTVTFEGEEPATRYWILEQATEDGYEGTLSDAAGTVSGHTVGSVLFLEYRVKGPIVMHQTLQLLPGDGTIDNRGRLTLFGIPIGHLRETIVRTPE